MNKLDKLFKIIEITVVSIVLMSIPILCPICIIYKWNPGLAGLLAVLTIFEFIALLSNLIDKSNKEEV